MGLFYVTPEHKAKFIKELQAALAKMESEVDETFRGMAIAAFHNLARQTPQWTGNAASNWNTSRNAPDYSTVTSLKEETVPRLSAKAKKDPVAIEIAIRRATPELMAIKRTDTVYLCNAAKNLDNKSYIQYLEGNPEGFLRPVNAPGHMVQRVALAAARFTKLSEVQQMALRAMKPGMVNNGGTGL